MRRLVISRAVAGYAERFFSPDGVHVEMGCGTAESSRRIAPARRLLVGLDFSSGALRAARRAANLGGHVQADIGRLPFRDASLGGIWNLGVMEHFEEEKGLGILREFARVLRPGACAVLFWPPEFGSSRLVLAPIEAVRSVLTRRRFRFFPDEVNRLRSPSHARRVLRAAGLEAAAIEFSVRDAFIHLVVVGRKPAS